MASSDSNNTTLPSPADEAGKYIGCVFLFAFWALCATSPFLMARLYRKWFSIRSPSPWDFQIPASTTLIGGFMYFVVSAVMIDYIDKHKFPFSRTATIFACVASWYVAMHVMVIVALDACLRVKSRRGGRITREFEIEDGIRMEGRKRDDGVARVS